ncbi:MAG: tetratricopeptide (TPR) repeat protein [Polyangiales bacterium]|jgi:tetratricopeptide (TPR) repeat protein
MADRGSFSLSGIRADGWFGRLASQGDHVRQLSEAIGEHVLAFSIIVGARITSVHVDPRNPDSSLVEFGAGEGDETHKVSLSEFRQRLAASLTSLEVNDLLPEDGEPSNEQLQAFIGFRTVLLSGLFGIGLETLHVGGELPPSLTVHVGAGDEEIPLDELRHALFERVRHETKERGGNVSLELSVVDEAETAAYEEDWKKVRALLEQWPSSLAMLLRSPDGYGLEPDVRDRLAHALGLLGTAYDRANEPERAAECYRLGVQWAQAQSTTTLAGLFVRYGESLVARGTSGQAIGMLRRALTLGAKNRDVLPLLSECYAASGSWLAALVCAENAQALGANSERLDAIHHEGAEELGDAWQNFRERIPAPSCSASTRPPPPELV